MVPVLSRRRCIQAEDNLAKGRSILELHQNLKRRVAEMTRSQYAIHALHWIFKRPVFRSPDCIRAAGIPEATARRVLSVLSREGVVRRLAAGRGRAGAVFVFPDHLNRAEGREVF